MKRALFCCGKCGRRVQAVFSDECPYCGAKRHVHRWREATCTEPKTCKRCGATDGEPLGHDWAEATYDKPKTCRRCGKTEGTVKGLVSSVSLTFVDESVDPVGTYYKIDTELKNCRRITVSYHLSEVKKGNVFGTCAFYVRSNGKWYRIGSIEVTELNKEYEKTFTISPSRTIDAIGETFEDATGAYSTMRKIKVLEAQVD